ncbi:MAG: hypothetical protein QMD86_00630 [Patescibacteria group bacterium]|nr:hypothetical protein [Patescibacteria group bacterium]
MLKEKILDIKNNIKEYRREHRQKINIVILLFLVSFLSFGLGCLINREFNHAPIIIEKCADFISKS